MVTPDFTPLASTVGGALIGLSASVLLLFEGRVAGISGVVGGLLTPRAGDLGWRVAFVAGLVTAGVVASLVAPSSMAIGISRPPWLVVVAGLLVGVGTRLGNGCTSGHGVCGLSRGSPRSLASVATFMTFGALAVVPARWLGGEP